MDITFINVGYGEAILVTVPDPERNGKPFIMMIDGGSNLDGEYTGESGRIRAVDFLKKKGITHIDLAVFTHIHEDHTSGLARVLSEIPADRFWTTIAMDPRYYRKTAGAGAQANETNNKALVSINAYSKLMAELPQEKITWLEGIRPAYFRKGGLVIDVLGPDPSYRAAVDGLVNSCFAAETGEALDAVVTATTEAMNNASLILRLHYEGKTVLLCGDTNASGFSHVMAADPALLKADVYKIGHHGQADSVSAQLVKAVDPSVIVCCASNDHRSNSSNPKTFETIRAALPGKEVTYLFQDGLYMAEWNPDTAPRNGITLRITESGIQWSRC